MQHHTNFCLVALFLQVRSSYQYISIIIMRTSHILLLCILGAALLSSVICSNGTGPDDCCFKFYPRKINKKLIRDYILTDNRCPKTGVILITQKSRHICADPSLSWVENIMKCVDEKTL
ncbi:C-C motif chemokine 3-like [Dicentrarchus labrax]|uniref:C-C motif chemokine n=1 Tax=Dicentrarchus labrax TaxID=13489 RepID=A0A8C4I3S3_DICLA|nr:C-C motif chemokine 3-like [Dicentrarchus labrax]